MIKRIDIYAEISKNIKKTRKELRLTQRDISDLTGYSYEFIRRIEAKNCPNYFSLGTIYEISFAMGVSMAELVKVGFEENCDNMFNNNLSFFENCSTEFHSFISNISLELRKKDSNYQKIDLENRIILKKYPKIGNILEEKEIDGLNKEECNAMAEYLDNSLFLKYKELEEIFLRGFREACFYLKRCNLLKEDNENIIKIDDIKGNT